MDQLKQLLDAIDAAIDRDAANGETIRDYAQKQWAEAMAKRDAKEETSTQ